MDQTKLIEDNIKLVYFVVNKHYPTYIGDEDIIQTGMIGLCKAAQNFDESKGTFSTFACKCIQNEIRIELRARSKQIPTLSLDYEYKGGDDSDSFNLTDMIIGDLDVGYIDLDSVYAKLNGTGKEVLELLLSGESRLDIATKLGVNLVTVHRHIRKIKNLVER